MSENTKDEERDIDPSIKFGDLVSFVSSDGEFYFFGDGVRNRCVGKGKKEVQDNFSDAIFKIQPKFEFKAAKEHKAFAKAKKRKAIGTRGGKSTEEIEGAIGFRNKVKPKRRQKPAGNVNNLWTNHSAIAHILQLLPGFQSRKIYFGYNC